MYAQAVTVVTIACEVRRTPVRLLRAILTIADEELLDEQRRPATSCSKRS